MVREKLTVGGKTTEVERRGKGVEYVLRCAPHDTYMTKFRMPKELALKIKLPDIVDPSYDKIAKIIAGLN